MSYFNIEVFHTHPLQMDKTANRLHMWRILYFSCRGCSGTEREVQGDLPEQTGHRLQLSIKKGG